MWRRTDWPACGPDQLDSAALVSNSADLGDSERPDLWALARRDVLLNVDLLKDCGGVK